MSEKRILCIGLCCLDIITVCKSFPKEDSDQRCVDHYWQRGGNASNSSSVLGLLGACVEFFGILVKGMKHGFLVEDFKRFGIRTDNCVHLEEGEDICTTAVIIINRENGSRTILASVAESEIKYEDFESRIHLSNYQWIHFEGRPNKDHMQRMMKRIDQYNATVPAEDRVYVSLELEKVKHKHLMELMTYVDYTFVSKEFASSLGYQTKEETVEKMISQCKPSGSVICAWGEDGAAAKSRSHDTVTSPIFPPEKLVDTLAAGDTFNGSTIYALSKGKDLQESITFGCRVAGAKCGMTGLKGLEGYQKYL